MNDKAVELGLEHTHYTDPSGLDPANVSSARDMARLIAFVSATTSASRPSCRSPSTARRPSRRQIVVHTTNRLLATDVQVQGGKTGFIRDAGYCLATLLAAAAG